MKIALCTSGMTNGDLDLSAFEKIGEVKYFGELSRKELFALVSDCEVLLINKVTVDEELLSHCPLLRYVGTFATGYNQVDINACNKRGITVCNVPDYSTNSVSQHVFALLLNFYGKITEYTASVAAGDWVKSKTFCYFPFPTRELSGKVFGIYGYGNIGKKVACIAKAFGAEVKICTRTVPENCPFECVSLETLLKTCDVVSLHCPLTEATAKMINAETLALMKKDAVLVNTARGGLVDEAALASALNVGRLAGACLDTVDVEPMAANNPLLNAKNCLITPHIAWVAKETRERLVGVAAANLAAFLSGKPQNTVN